MIRGRWPNRSWNGLGARHTSFNCSRWLRVNCLTDPATASGSAAATSGRTTGIVSGNNRRR